MDLNKLEKNAARRITEADVFSRRFGSFSKADYEVLMFTIYLDNLPPDKRVYDYQISLELGITESKVRSLRTKSQLLYPRDLLWQDELINAIRQGEYNKSDNSISITIEDPSCRNRIRFEVESANGSVGLTLNSKQLRLPVDSVIALALKIDAGSEEMILKELNQTWQKIEKQRGEITKEQLGKRILKTCKNVAELLSTTVSIWSTASPMIKAVIGISQ